MVKCIGREIPTSSRPSVEPPPKLSRETYFRAFKDASRVFVYTVVPHIHKLLVLEGQSYLHFDRTKEIAIHMKVRWNAISYCGYLNKAQYLPR